MRLAIAVTAFCLPLISNSAAAQQEKGKEAVITAQKPVVAYRIEFNVREIEDGKRLNSRNYVLMAEDGAWGKVRVGSKVQWRETRGEGQELHYQDVGMSIDCRPREQEGSVALDIHVEWTGVAPQAGADPTFRDRLFRTDKAEVQSIVTLGKPTLVASMDDTESNRRYEIEVTATKVK
jgi:hypothetical protein